MTREEYELAKGARIALLCIGDIVYHVFRHVGLVWDGKDQCSYPVTIRKCKILEISENSIKTTSVYSTQDTTTWSFRILEMHEGSLYIWPGLATMEHEKRMKRLIAILESPDTQFE
jgi:hypothetical protein